MALDLVHLITAKLRELADQEEIVLPEELSADTPLFGREGLLDSLGLVSLVVAVEQGIEDELGSTVSLADERAFSQRNSPYLTVGSLAAYAEGLLGEAV